MNFKTKAILGAVLLASTAVKAQDIKTEKDSLSYAIGVDIASSFVKQNIDINHDVLSRAIKETLYKTSKMTEDEAAMFIRNYFMNQSMRVAKDNKEKSEAFLAKNKTEAGVVTLPSGLQYKVVEEGQGAIPTLNDRVKVHYTGTTVDGNVFDSSVQRGEPVTFGVTQVIKGWTEALQLMPVGSKWRLFIPDSLAYGAQAPPAIGPNQALIFDVELIDIEK